MGLLDDAIREHLELKRRRGADPDEVERLEQEALGPVRRDAEPAPEPVVRSAAAAQETQEFHVEELVEPAPAAHPEPPAAEPEPELIPADEEPPLEDVLEETPEFLEETPEHDRLWFEQRPPRDFDFGG